MITYDSYSSNNVIPLLTLETLVQNEVAHEGETGKVSKANFHDRLGRPVLIMRPGMQVSTTVLVFSTFLSKKKKKKKQRRKKGDKKINSLVLSHFLQNTNSPEGNIRHLVYLIENGVLNLPEDQEQMSWLVDFTGFGLNTNISVKTARDIINILQCHYPERLAVVFLYNPPRIFQAFYKV